MEDGVCMLSLLADVRLQVQHTVLVRQALSWCLRDNLVWALILPLIAQLCSSISCLCCQGLFLHQQPNPHCWASKPSPLVNAAIFFLHHLQLRLGGGPRNISLLSACLLPPLHPCSHPEARPTNLAVWVPPQPSLHPQGEGRLERGMFISMLSPTWNMLVFHQWCLPCMWGMTEQIDGQDSEFPYPWVNLSPMGNVMVRNSTLSFCAAWLPLHS